MEAGSAPGEFEATVPHEISRIARTTAAVVFVTVGVLCMVISAPAIWSRNLLLNTDRYLETLAPVTQDPAVQGAIVKAVDNSGRAYGWSS